MLHVLREHEGEYPIEIGSVEDLPTSCPSSNGLPHAVVHSASNVDVAALYRDPYRAFESNVRDGQRLRGRTPHRRQARGRHLVDRVLPPTSTSRSTPPTPSFARSGPGSGAYGASKVAGEVFGFAFHQAYGLDVRIVRPSAVYGFGMQWHSANYMKQFVEPAVRGEPVRVSSGGKLPRDYTHVADVASLTMRVVDCPDDADRIFYAATGGPPSRRRRQPGSSPSSSPEATSRSPTR
jgi:nucleoside-diphosphate-sugar epimerase